MADGEGGCQKPRGVGVVGTGVQEAVDVSRSSKRERGGKQLFIRWGAMPKKSGGAREKLDMGGRKTGSREQEIFTPLSIPRHL